MDYSLPGSCPLDSPEKSTGVGCHVLLQGSYWPRDRNCVSYISYTGRWFFTTSATWEAYTVLCVVAQSCPTLCNPVDCSPSGPSVHGDTPGKNTRVGCPPPRDLPNPGTESRSLTLQVDFLLSEPPRKPKNTGVGSPSFLQGIFPTQESNRDLPHCRQILYQLSHKRSPRTLEWVAYPFSRGSSWPRDWTGVSCISGRFFSSWATREVQCIHYYVYFEFTLGIRNSLFSVLFP